MKVYYYWRKQTRKLNVDIVDFLDTSRKRLELSWNSTTNYSKLRIGSTAQTEKYEPVPSRNNLEYEFASNSTLRRLSHQKWHAKGHHGLPGLSSVWRQWVPPITKATHVRCRTSAKYPLLHPNASYQRTDCFVSQSCQCQSFSKTNHVQE